MRMGGWRVVLIAQVPEVAAGIPIALRTAGHDPVAVLCVRQTRTFGELAEAVPDDVDLISPSTRARIAPLLAAADPDLVICLGFPWKIPADALAVPRLGAINVHPSRLPRYRGPIPLAHALLNGDTELGMTIHRMDPELDTGPILAQATVPIGDAETVETMIDKLRELTQQLLPVALERVAWARKASRRPRRVRATQASWSRVRRRSTGAAGRGRSITRCSP
jgi:methionyl-tRNA formyltransferase